MNNSFNKMALAVLTLILPSDIDNAFTMNAKPNLISSTRHALSDDTLEFLANASEDYLKEHVCIQLETTSRAPRNTVIYEGKIYVRVNPKRIEEGKYFVYTHWVYEPSDATLDVVSIFTQNNSYNFTEGPIYDVSHNQALVDFAASTQQYAGSEIS